jgi:probable DNA metabolism protein
MPEAFYIYDGSFDGLLTVAATLLQRDETPTGLVAEGVPLQGDLFATPMRISTDSGLAGKLRATLRRRVPADALGDAAAAFLHVAPDRELAIFAYLKLGLETGQDLPHMLADPAVDRVRRLAQQVRCEGHRLMGLLRFQELDGGILYAPVRPDHDVIGMLARHFQKRTHDLPWVIHDLGRRKALHWDTRELQSVAVDPVLEQAAAAGGTLRASLLSGDELAWQQAWKIFFKHVAIPERTNPRCQANFMPKRYWAHMTETDEREQAQKVPGILSTKSTQSTTSTTPSLL